jgi:hypothetical protein
LPWGRISIIMPINFLIYEVSQRVKIEAIQKKHVYIIYLLRSPLSDRNLILVVTYSSLVGRRLTLDDDIM